MYVPLGHEVKLLPRNLRGWWIENENHIKVYFIFNEGISFFNIILFIKAKNSYKSEALIIRTYVYQYIYFEHIHVPSN
jgi:hypothetical protein